MNLNGFCNFWPFYENMLWIEQQFQTAKSIEKSYKIIVFLYISLNWIDCCNCGAHTECICYCHWSVSHPFSFAFSFGLKVHFNRSSKCMHRKQWELRRKKWSDRVNGCAHFEPILHTQRERNECYGNSWWFNWRAFCGGLRVVCGLKISYG